jgi:fructoselysine-6-phosphate deglycase
MGVATLEPIAPDYEALLEGVLKASAQIDAMLGGVVDGGLRNVFLVGSGGSWANLTQVHFFLESAAPLPVFLHSSGELLVREPVGLGAGSLVLAASHRGETPETVEAARVARDRGATVVALTRDATSPLATNAQHVLEYGREEIVIDAKHIHLALIGTRLVELTTGSPRDPSLDSAFAALPAAVVAAMEEREAANAEIAERLQNEPITYIVGAGPTFGMAYSLAMCTLQEAQWLHAAAFDAAEMFHGMFEVIEPGVAVLFLLDESAARPLVERTLAFAERYTDKAIGIDTRDLTLPGVPAGHRALMSPIALGAVVYRLAAHYAAVRGRGLDDRRYMFKVPY